MNPSLLFGKTALYLYSQGNNLNSNTKSQLVLFCYEGHDFGRTIALTSGVTIGRGKNCDTQLDDVYCPQEALFICEQEQHLYYRVKNDLVKAYADSSLTQKIENTGRIGLGFVFVFGHLKFVVTNSPANCCKESEVVSQTSVATKKNHHQFIYTLVSLLGATSAAMIFNSPYFMLFATLPLLAQGATALYTKLFGTQEAETIRVQLPTITPAKIRSSAIAYGKAQELLFFPQEVSQIYLFAPDHYGEKLLRWLIVAWVLPQNHKVHCHGSLPAWLPVLVEAFNLNLLLCTTPLCTHTGATLHYNCPHPTQKKAKDNIDIDLFDLQYSVYGLSWQTFLQQLVDFQQLNPALTQSGAYYCLEPHGYSFFAGLTVENNSPLWLSLEQHGPHFCLSGATGTGKTEFLITALHSLAAHYATDELSFFICDFKGGSGLTSLKDFPHTSFFLSDHDIFESSKALRLLAYEIQRREKILVEHHVLTLKEYNQRNEASKIPALLIVIDEYRILYEELPEHLTTLSKIASIGRSLGLHLFISAQTMQGIMPPAISTNIGSTITLKQAGTATITFQNLQELCFRPLMLQHLSSQKKCLLAYGHTTTQDYNITTTIPDTVYYSSLREKIYQQQQFHLFPAAFCKKASIADHPDSESIVLGEIELPEQGKTSAISWSAQTSKLAVLSDTIPDSFFHAVLAQLLHQAKRCAVIGTIADKEIAQCLYFHGEITELENLSLLLREELTAVLILDWDKLYNLLKNSHHPQYLQEFEHYIHHHQGIMLKASEKFMNWNLNHLFTHKVLYAKNTLAQLSSSPHFKDHLKHLPADIAVLDFPDISEYNYFYNVEDEELPALEAMPRDFQSLTCLPQSSAGKIIYGLKRREFIWNFRSDKSIILTAPSLPSLAHLTECIMASVHSEAIQSYDASTQEDLICPKHTEILIIEQCKELSFKADEQLLELMHEGNIAICFTETIDRLHQTHHKSYQKCKQQQLGIIVNPIHRHDGTLIGQAIDIMPTTLANRG
ncbi:MAG: FtsK/SpoIIIE domain-containing protein, partial [Micrococcaceae bacterium]